MADDESRGLSDEARSLDDQLRGTVEDLTGERVRRRGRGWRGASPAVVGLVLAIVVVFVALLVGLLGSGSDDDDVTIGVAPTPAPGGAAVTAPVPSEPGDDGAADCEVGDVVEVAAELTRTIPGTHATAYQGRITFTNTGDEPVFVVFDTWLYTGPTGMDDRGWYGGPYELAPGETREELVSMGGSEARGYTWTMVPRFVVFGGTTACLTEFGQRGDAGYEAIARPVANPFPVPLPAG
jgi:hypothetical protein